MRQPGRVDLRGASYGASIRLFFDAQVNPSPLRQLERLKRPECALGEDSLYMTDHERTLRRGALMYSETRRFRISMLAAIKFDDQLGSVAIVISDIG
jgi:hypothetical protein